MRKTVSAAERCIHSATTSSNLKCTCHCKTTVSNKIRDGLKPLLKTGKRIMHLTCSISNELMVDKESPCLLYELPPNLRSFDISVILFNHMLGESSFAN